MENDDLKVALMEVFGLSGRSMEPLALRGTLNRRNGNAAVAYDLVDEASAGDPPAEHIVAYLTGTLGEDECAKIRARMLASPAFFDEVTSTADYLDEIEALGEPQPSLIARLEAFFNGGKVLEADLLQALRNDPALRAQFQKLKQQRAALIDDRQLEMTALAAAASDEHPADDRAFNGGQVSIRKSPGENAMLIVFVLDRPPLPRALLLEGPEGEIVRTALPEPRASGNIFLIKSLDNEEDRLFVQLLRDPRSKGTFLS